MKKYYILLIPAVGAGLIVLSFALNGVSRTVCFITGLVLAVLGLLVFVYTITKSKETDKNKYKQKRLMTEPELEVYQWLQRTYEPRYRVLPQIALLSLVDKVNNTSYRNELFRVVDFVIFDGEYRPLCAIELNDASHNRADRKMRDEKVKSILGRAGVGIAFIPLEEAKNEKLMKKLIADAVKHRKW